MVPSRGIPGVDDPAPKPAPKRSKTARYLGTRIRDLRKARGISTETLGAKAGHSSATVRRIEHGDGDVHSRISTYEDLARALGVKFRADFEE